MTINIKKIVVVGAGIDAWLTALFIKTEFLKYTVDNHVELIDTGCSISTHKCFSVLPGYRQLHEQLGANEEALLRSAKSTRFYAQRFSGWNAYQNDYFIAYDKPGVDIAGAKFYQCWQKARKNGLSASFEEFSLGILAAKHGKLVVKCADESLQPPHYGYHLDASNYTAAIKRAAIARGVNHRASDIHTVTINDGNIDGLLLTDGDYISGDLFIDASGSKRRLLRELGTNEFESWSAWFKYDKQISCSANKFQTIPGFSQITAFAEGWFGLYPLQDRTAVQIHYSSTHISHENVIKKVSVLCGAALSPSPAEDCSYGVIKKPWSGNCIGVGTAACSLDSLDAVELFPLVTSLSLLRDYFPQDSNQSLESKKFNERFTSHMCRLRDFQLAHYFLNGRTDDEFWNAYRTSSAPESLVKKMEVFKKIGFVSLLEDETFDEHSWTYLLNGSLLGAMNHDPFVDSIPEEILKERFYILLKSIAKTITESGSLN
ncbi:MAG: tryptophan 7-halogenase [Cellvibrio sp.]|uniref:tryptophan 7-halogenase n=1 Tax=Cellvibrio sp. TaxID=1965322 RepID=UPI00271C5309|nr:tryptophan 7-halogenase [Cellvibrio sp.]